MTIPTSLTSSQKGASHELCHENSNDRGSALPGALALNLARECAAAVSAQIGRHQADPYRSSLAMARTIFDVCGQCYYLWPHAQGVRSCLISSTRQGSSEQDQLVT